MFLDDSWAHIDNNTIKLQFHFDINWLVKLFWSVNHYCIYSKQKKIVFNNFYMYMYINAESMVYFQMKKSLIMFFNLSLINILLITGMKWYIVTDMILSIRFTWLPGWNKIWIIVERHATSKENIKCYIYQIGNYQIPCEIETWKIT